MCMYAYITIIHMCVFLHVYIYIYIHIYTYIYVNTYIYIHTYFYMYICVCICLYISPDRPDKIQGPLIYLWVCGTSEPAALVSRGAGRT